MALADTLRRIAQPKSEAVEYFEMRLKYEIGPALLKEKMDHGHQDFQVIDVRTRAAYNQGHIPGAWLVPYQEIDDHISEFSFYKENIVYGYSMTCQLSYDVARKLAEQGYTVKVLIGGFEEWERRRLPTSTE